jgi:hypothetical protein
MWREKLESEARAKIFWGDSPESVLAYVQSQGFTKEEAEATIHGIVQERIESLKGFGRRNILIGIPLLLVPVASYLVLRQLGIFPIKIFAVTVVIGLFGGFKLARGTMMLLSPGSMTGDLSDPSET